MVNLVHGIVLVEADTVKMERKELQKQLRNRGIQSHLHKNNNMKLTKPFLT
jgi:hypothetical protein